jgi:CheY-like chemotaxis protein
MLIVEDNPGDAHFFQIFFRQEPKRTEFHYVSDGLSALNFLWNRGSHITAPRPDIIVLDIHLPQLNGTEVLREIKKDPSLRTIPVLVLTSAGNEMEVRTCYEYGANCVLNKASNIEQASQLFQLIENFWVQSVLLTRQPTVQTALAQELEVC